MLIHSKTSKYTSVIKLGQNELKNKPKSQLNELKKQLLPKVLCPKVPVDKHTELSGRYFQKLVHTKLVSISFK